MILSLLLATAEAYAELPGATATWTPLAESPVAIDCTAWKGKPYCRSTGVITAPVSQAASVFAGLDQHVAKMGAISRIQRLEADVLHVVMEYPFPLTDRDYVARFSRRQEGSAEVFSWVPVVHAGAPVSTDTIRLTWLDGEWRFAPEGTNTRVTYTWQADPGGNLPDVGAVRSKAGYLAVLDIANACGAQLVSP